ncbi:MAG: DUF3307 domain-containing protein [Patescibacteria group bacterium]
MPQLLLALAAHFIGDFPFQPEFLAMGKGKSWELNFYHAAVYTATFLLVPVGLSPLSLGIILVSHFFIDPCKARYGWVKKIWQDQLMHMIVIAFVLLVTK